MLVTVAVGEMTEVRVVVTVRVGEMTGVRLRVCVIVGDIVRVGEITGVNVRVCVGVALMAGVLVAVTLPQFGSLPQIRLPFM